MKLDRRSLEGRNTVEEGTKWHMMLEQKGGQEKGMGVCAGESGRREEKKKTVLLNVTIKPNSLYANKIKRKAECLIPVLCETHSCSCSQMSDCSQQNQGTCPELGLCSAPVWSTEGALATVLHSSFSSLWLV